MSSCGVFDVSAYFTDQPLLLQICCNKHSKIQQCAGQTQMDSFVLLLFENGPLTVLRLFGGNGCRNGISKFGLTADVVMQQYMKQNNVEKAINILLCLNWDTQGSILMMSLQKIASYILKQPFQPDREVQLQKALGSFLVPVKPLRKETRMEFGDQIRDIIRKFFQYLLRHKSYEKAFNLAIDIDDEDLFMDLFNCAREDGYTNFSNDAYHKADEILRRSSSERSTRKFSFQILCYRAHFGALVQPNS